MAEIVGEYLRKGSQVYVEGSLRTQKWQDEQGNDRYTTEIIASDMQMLGGRQDQGQNNAPQPTNNQQNQGQGVNSGVQQKANMPNPADEFDDDIPF